MPETGEILRRSAARPGRCSVHPNEAAVDTCAICERGLCLACAVPVRGRVVGSECLATLVEDPPPQPAPSRPRRPPGDWFALFGFLVALGSSAFPWARFGTASGTGEAWTLHWSVVSVASAAIGALVVVVMRRRRTGVAVFVTALVVLATAVAGGAVLHMMRPPPISNVSGTWPWRFAVFGAALVLAGAARKVLARHGIHRR